MKTFRVHVHRLDTFEVQAETPEEADAIVFRMHCEYATEAGVNLNESDEGDPVYWAGGAVDIPREEIEEIDPGEETEGVSTNA